MSADTLGIHNSPASFPGLLLPMFRATGEPISFQYKPAREASIRGRRVKYLSPSGAGNHLDVHPRNRDHIKDVTVSLWLTEGIKKGDSLSSRGCCVVTLTGVYNWRNRFGTLGDWEDVPLKGREVVLCFDADARTNMNVARAMVRLGRWCRSKGAKAVRYLIVPSEFKGKPTKGVDDYFAAGGSIDELKIEATTSEPETDKTEDTFSDSRLAETIADDVITGRFLWCKALGWMRWTGQVWTRASEESVGEAVRRYVLRRFGEAVQAQRKAFIEGWSSVLSAARQRAVLALTRGIEERTAESFDDDPDLLNTPSGVVVLRTGELLPHEPDLLMTKITRGSYRPGYMHPDWDQALMALPEETRPWFQTRVGQAITGYPTPDGLILVCQGSGENGKSAVTSDGIVPALGDYAAPASSKLFTSSKDEHSTERADLRGQRFLVAEELTEERALNVTAMKQITDVSVIKARYVFRDNFTFTASHSLFITTNYIPVVHETDHGTWRRLALVDFPFTFRKSLESIRTAADRHGDAGLKARIRSGKNGQHDAIVTWAVEGAFRWYASGFPPLPIGVEEDTRDWRKQVDRILSFWDECLEADRNMCITTSDLQYAFNAWMLSNGYNAWSKELFGSRFKGHTETQRHHVEERRPRRLDPDYVSRPSGGPAQATRPSVYVGVGLRTSNDIATSAKGGRTERSEPSGSFSKYRRVEKVTKRSDHADRQGDLC